MRLLNTANYELEEFAEPNTPPYAILSHRWQSKEVAFHEYQANQPRDSPAYQKITKACDFARDRDHQWLWVDTCCIDRRSSAELSEAINSMCRWYADAEECFAYLSDVHPLSQGLEKVRESFKSSDWFNRGWTLQELIMPSYVTFCTSDWEVLGVKSAADGEQDLSIAIWEVTGIPVEVLRDRKEIRSYSAAQKLSWAAHRETSRIEDRAYSLIGLFNVHMPLLYGERIQAFRRLLEEILRTSNDETLFAWHASSFRQYHQMQTLGRFVLQHVMPLPGYPIAYGQMGRMRQPDVRGNPRFTFTNGLIKFKSADSSDLVRLDSTTYCVTLRCAEYNNGRVPTHPPRQLLLQQRACGHYSRLEFEPPLQNIEELFPRRFWYNCAEKTVIYLHATADTCGKFSDYLWDED